MTEYDSFIFDKDVANAYRDALDEINGLDASKLALGELEIMIARVLLLLKAINEQARRNRVRQRQQQAAPQAAQTAQAGAIQSQAAGANRQQELANQIYVAVEYGNKKRRVQK